jgi:hypothetical protein
MGFKSYFQTSVKVAATQVVPDNEKFAGSLPGTLAAPTDSETASLSPAASSRATQEDRLVDEIKHQVVLNHLYQHQCSSLWIRDVGLQVEGVMVRKRRNDYLFKPPGLQSSAFAQAMMVLNVQVSLFLFSSNGGRVIMSQPEYKTCFSAHVSPLSHIAKNKQLTKEKGSDDSLIWRN